jgi:uncharacterized C2H2 Zn-finger protein
VAHQRANHGESRPFACAEPGCGKAFGYKQVLERHIAKCHGSRPAKRAKRVDAAALQHVSGRLHVVHVTSCRGTALLVAEMPS